MDSHIEFVWHEGIAFSQLSKLIFEYFTEAGLTFKHFTLPEGSDGGRAFKQFAPPGAARSGIFKVVRYKCEPPFEFPDGPWVYIPYRKNKITRLPEFTDRPWEDDPWVKPDIGDINWVVLKDLRDDRNPDRWWGVFHTRIEESLRYFNKSMPTKVHHLRVGVNGDFLTSCGEKFEGLCDTYRQVKELYRILDCDEVFVESENGEDFKRKFPHYRSMSFRIAKQGTQVLVKRMEERRPMPELGWQHSRIFIDPPGVQALSPEEYAKRAGLL